MISRSGRSRVWTHGADSERFVRLLEEHKRILYKVSSLYSAGEDRRDLVQEMVVQLWRAFPRYDSRFKFSTWMYRIAMNVAMSSLRREGRRGRETLPLEQVDPIDFAATDQAMGKAADDLRLLRRLLSRLDEMSRALVVLYLEGYSHVEIADALGISATNVGTKICRIKSRLQRELGALTAKTEGTADEPR